MVRRVKQTAWSNWNGYEGSRKVLEFGADNLRAGHWLLTGEDRRNAAYVTPQHTEACRNAALAGKL
jgi:hypothetical protein